MNYNIDKSKAFIKWAPIMNNIGYNGDKIKELSTYCEMHSIIEASLSSYKDFKPFSLPLGPIEKLEKPNLDALDALDVFDNITSTFISNIK